MAEIAVILSVYQGDKLTYLQTALESLYGQKMGADIFVQLDGIVSKEITHYLKQELGCGRIIHLGERDINQGLAHSLNELLEIVMGEDYPYIARMDADDIAYPERIALQYRFMEEHLDVDVVGGAIEEFMDGGSYQNTVHYPLDHAAIHRFFAKRVPLAHVTAFYRKSYFDKAGVYPTQSPTNEDTLMWMRGFDQGCRFANLPQALVKVRVSESFFSRRGGFKKAWSDLRDRVLVIRTLGYNITSYGYALALFFVNIAPARLKQILYKRLR